MASDPETSQYVGDHNLNDRGDYNISTQQEIIIKEFKDNVALDVQSTTQYSYVLLGNYNNIKMKSIEFFINKNVTDHNEKMQITYFISINFYICKEKQDLYNYVIFLYL